MITEGEYVNRILGRIEGCIHHSFSREGVEKVKDFIRLVSKEPSACLSKKHFATIEVEDIGISVPLDIFLVHDYNQFDMKKEFNKKY